MVRFKNEFQKIENRFKNIIMYLGFLQINILINYVLILN